tara:strand:+ start:433 stop:1344 length:912 start_codon:yes stop_codon:yes gene_type:complete
MSDPRISFVYNSDIRNNGTPTLAFNSVKHQLGWNDKVDRWRPEGELPERELYIYVDDGRDDLEWKCPGPSAYWAVDTHLGYDYRLWKARQFDKVYCAQKEGVEKMRKDGIKEVYWLPLACNPMAHPNLSEMMLHKNKDDHTWGKGLDKKYDLAFVGFLNEGDGSDTSNNRIEWLDHAFSHFPNSWLAWQCFFEDMAVRIIRARLGFNISIRNDLNMRFFEVLSTGTCLLTNTTVEGIDDLGFEEGKHFVGYKDKEELVDKTKYFLKNPMEREGIARSGHEKVRSGHTYDKRMQRILDDFQIAA